MGDEVAAAVFTSEDRTRYREKVKRCLDVFARMLAEARFDSDSRSIGFEIELNITDETGDPAMANQRVLDMIADADWSTELGQFNIEIGIPPHTLGGAVLGELERDGAGEPQPRGGGRAEGPSPAVDGRHPADAQRAARSTARC